MSTVPKGTVRGNITEYLKKNQILFSAPVLEIGSRLPSPQSVWANNRFLLDEEEKAKYEEKHQKKGWLGVDYQEGLNVDLVMDAEQLQFPENTFKTVLCSEVLEHVKKPWDVINESYRVLQQGGWGIFTTVFAFPVHGYPCDYWRFTPDCLEMLLANAGFKNISSEVAGEFPVGLNNIGRRVEERVLFTHVFIKGRKA